MSGHDADRLNTIHRATYNGVAARYAVVNEQMPPAVLDSAQQLLVAVGASARILELGCGHGRDAAWFEARGAYVVAVDLSAGMLAETQRRVSGPIVQLNMRDLAFRDMTYDGVWSNAAMLHLPKSLVPQALSEVRRVLRPDGVFFVSLQVGAGESWEAVSYGQPRARFFSRYAPTEFAELIAAAGMEVFDLQESHGGPRKHWVHYFARRGEPDSRLC